MRDALANRDIVTVYALLQRFGISQRAIAARTGQSQSEISEILTRRRQVSSYNVLVRIAEGSWRPARLARPGLRHRHPRTHRMPADNLINQTYETGLDPHEGVEASGVQQLVSVRWNPSYADRAGQAVGTVVAVPVRVFLT